MDLQNSMVTSTTGGNNNIDDDIDDFRRVGIPASGNSVPFWPPSMDSRSGTTSSSSSSLNDIGGSSNNSFLELNLDTTIGQTNVSEPIPIPGTPSAIERPSRPPFHNQNYQEARYKTELCLHFRDSNTCVHGANCLFAHGLEELRPYRGRHPKHKTQLCKAFHEQGFCNYGYRCSYIHSESPRTIRYIRELNDRARRARHRQHQRRPNGAAQRFHSNRSMDISAGSGTGGRSNRNRHGHRNHRNNRSPSLAGIESNTIL